MHSFSVFLALAIFSGAQAMPLPHIHPKHITPFSARNRGGARPVNHSNVMPRGLVQVCVDVGSHVSRVLSDGECDGRIEYRQPNDPTLPVNTDNSVSANPGGHRSGLGVGASIDILGDSVNKGIGQGNAITPTDSAKVPAPVSDGGGLLGSLGRTLLGLGDTDNSGARSNSNPPARSDADSAATSDGRGGGLTASVGLLNHGSSGSRSSSQLSGGDNGDGLYAPGTGPVFAGHYGPGNQPDGIAPGSERGPDNGRNGRDGRKGGAGHKYHGGNEGPDRSEKGPDRINHEPDGDDHDFYGGDVADGDAHRSDRGEHSSDGDHHGSDEGDLSDGGDHDGDDHAPGGEDHVPGKHDGSERKYVDGQDAEDVWIHDDSDHRSEGFDVDDYETEQGNHEGDYGHKQEQAGYKGIEEGEHDRHLAEGDGHGRNQHDTSGRGQSTSDLGSKKNVQYDERYGAHSGHEYASNDEPGAKHKECDFSDNRSVIRHDHSPDLQGPALSSHDQTESEKPHKLLHPKQKSSPMPKNYRVAYIPEDKTHLASHHHSRPSDGWTDDRRGCACRQ